MCKAETLEKRDVLHAWYSVGDVQQNVLRKLVQRKGAFLIQASEIGLHRARLVHSAASFRVNPLRLQGEPSTRAVFSCDDAQWISSPEESYFTSTALHA